ncbi:MAG TPA: YceH family protein [Usitatibacter sp.]|jgi:hypothetical protein|nr:YceH family protein [Usitatibacter sp.]
MGALSLSLLEARILGVLVEKQHTVPDSCPLTLNALVSGCNQKSSRDPVIEASEGEVQAALDRLKTLSLVMETSGGRVMRYSQNVGKVLGIPPQSVALLAVLFLRGPQTAGELRINSDRLHRFGDILAVQAFLDELAGRRDGALVRELPRAPGARETRWMHLLCGDAEAAAATATTGGPGADEVAAAPALAGGEIESLRARVERLEAEVEALRELVRKLHPEAGGS